MTEHEHDQSIFAQFDTKTNKKEGMATPDWAYLSYNKRAGKTTIQDANNSKSDNNQLRIIYRFNNQIPFTYILPSL